MALQLGIDLLPDDASVELESGRIAKAGGFRVPTITECTLTTPLLMFENAAQEKPGTFAVWPPGGEGRVQRIDWGATKGGSAGFPEKDRVRLATALGKLSPVDSVHVVQVASAETVQTMRLVPNHPVSRAWRVRQDGSQVT